MFFEVERVSKRYKNKLVLDNIHFAAEHGEIVSLIGPSGVGKTTLLKIIARLEKADSGRVTYSDSDFKKHPVILVFQDYVLFDNLSVFENVAFGLKARKMPKEEIKDKVQRIIAYFNLEDKLNFYPKQLSAGQKQRVAIARAMVLNPSILLLDEPFANLDKNLKFDTAQFIRATQKKFNITTICVTHDQEEAFLMSDKIGVMLDGRIHQYDTAKNIYYKPASYEVARFLGNVNVIPAGLYSAFDITSEAGEVFSRAESIEIIKDKRGPGRVKEVVFAGHYVKYTVCIGEKSFTIHNVHNDIKKGDTVTLKAHNYIKK